MTNPFQNMIVAAVEQKPEDFTQEFNAAIQEKLQAQVANYKAFLQATLLGDEPPVEKEEAVSEDEALDIQDVFEMFMDDHPDEFENLEDAVVAFAKEVELTEDETVEFYDYLTEEDEETVDEEQIDELSKELLQRAANKAAEKADSAHKEGHKRNKQWGKFIVARDKAKK